MSAPTRSAWRRLSPLVALLALLAAPIPDVLHRDGLHASRLGGTESVSEGCGQHHPPRFEPRGPAHRADCAACLLKQLHGRATIAAAARLAPALTGQVMAIVPTAADASERFSISSPRGPPALPA
jgi:hypothetical protein